MNIWGGIRLGVSAVLLCALSLVAVTRASASTETFTGSPDAVVRTLIEAEPDSTTPNRWARFTVRMQTIPVVESPTPTPVPARPVPARPVPATAIPAILIEPTPVPTVAAVPAPVPAPAPADHVARGQAALARINYDLSSVGYTISFHPGNQAHLGLTFTRNRHIEIYVRQSMSNATLAYVIGHEMGHAVDHIRNTTADRQRWSAARGMAANGAWWPVGVGSDLATPAGDFAECFASWATGSPSHSSWGGCGSAMPLMGELAYG